MAGPWLILCRLGILAALAASGALYIHYANPVDAAFCAANSGCETVRRSAISYLGTRYLSLPLVGLVAYGTVLWASLAWERRAWLTRLAGAGGALGAVLLAAQALWIKEFCWLCVIADGSAIWIGITAWLAGRSEPPKDPLRPNGWIALAVLASITPVAWTLVRPAPPVPAPIAELYAADKINVVEFMDFQCPFCRAYHPTLKKVMASYPPDAIRFVRQHVPLEQHRLARPAARATLCAAADGKAEALADRLVDMELDPKAIRRAAVELEVAMPAFDRCIEAEKTDAQIDLQIARLVEAGMQGLPTTYVAGQRFVGAVSEEALRDAFDRALRGETDTGIPGPVFLLLLISLVGGVAWWGRQAGAKIPHDTERPADAA